MIQNLQQPSTKEEESTSSSNKSSSNKSGTILPSEIRQRNGDTDLPSETRQRNGNVNSQQDKTGVCFLKSQVNVTIGITARKETERRIGITARVETKRSRSPTNTSVFREWVGALSNSKGAPPHRSGPGSLEELPLPYLFPGPPCSDAHTVLWAGPSRAPFWNGAQTHLPSPRQRGRGLCGTV